MADQADTNEILALTADIVAAHVSNNTVGVAELPQLIQQVYASLSTLGQAPAPTQERPHPAVPIKKSVTPEYIICLEDGKKLKMLKRNILGFVGFSPIRDLVLGRIDAVSAERRQLWLAEVEELGRLAR